MSATSTSTTPHNRHHSQQSNPKLQQKFYHQRQQKEHPDITREEFDRISEAFKKEEFRKLFQEYVDEIQDPENRKIYEQEITQIEAERGVDVVFINPQPGFVIKTSQDGSQKCFINCAKSEHVGKPTNEICSDPKTGTQGLSWSIPMAQAPPRDDLDNKKKRCRVYDVVFHPDALYLAERNGSFHKCLVDTALDAVEREYKVKLDRVNIKFPKLQFKGMARPTVIRKLAKNPPAECNEPHPLENIYPAKPSADAGTPKVLPMKTVECGNRKKSSDYSTPNYTIKHRHDVDLSEYTNELDAKLHVSTPHELVVDIELPLLYSTSECQLDVTAKTLFLLSERVGAKYRLNIDLPFIVKDKEGTAKFDVDTRHLIITLPVMRPSVEKERQMHESLLHLCREDSGVESDVRDELLSSHSESPVEEKSLTNMEQTLNNKASEEISLDRPSALKNAEIENNFLHSNIDYQLPAKFECNVLDNTMSWVLHVRNVQEESLEIKRCENELHLKFISLGSGYYPSHYSFYIKLSPEEKEAKILEADAEAWENNVVLNLHLNTNAECIASYLAGLDSDHLQEYVIQEKFKVAHKSRQRQKDEQQPSLDISIERSECEKTVEIEIKSRPLEVSTCNANTTEDEETNSGTTDTLSSQQPQKKVNKKQKRKNKKRRSLSESACDDIKAYQQQQQQQQKQLQKSLIISNPVPEIKENEHEENADDADDDGEDSSPDRKETSLKSLHPTSLSMNVPSANNFNNSALISQQRKQRSFSESRDSAISFSAGSSSFKGILKHYSRYEPRPSISDSCDSIDEFSSSTYSTSVDGMPGTFNSLRFSQSFSDIPEENVVGLSESCKKTVRFSEVIKKQVFRLDSSILGQRKKNQKRRDRRQRALQRRLSEGDSADYEDNKPMASLPSSTLNAQYLKTKPDPQHAANNCKSGHSNKQKTSDKKSNKMRARLESESSSDMDNHKSSMMFEMDM